MRSHSLAVVLLASCLAHPVSGDAGTSPDAVAGNACTAAGGTCIAPGPECLAEISASSGCPAANALCCTVAGTTVTAPTVDASTGTTSTDGATSTCNTTCEGTCEGDPVCIQSCGC